MANICTNDAGLAGTHRAMGTAAAAVRAPTGAVPAAAAGEPAIVVSKSLPAMWSAAAVTCSAGSDLQYGRR